MTSTDSKAWFHAKRDNPGWNPPTWQGRVVLSLYLAISVVCISFLSESHTPLSMVMLNVILGFLFWLKSERPLGNNARMSILLLIAISIGFIGNGIPVQYVVWKKIFSLIPVIIMILAFVRYIRSAA